ncbi:MAG: hypothetical protein JWP46_2625 [Modestobacter sp.]|nr:hypothetical protein [Modestobacter sp.]
MSVPAATVPASAGRPGRLVVVLRTQRPVERACYLIAAVLVLSGLVHLGVAVAFPRPWGGPLSWRKPVTFGTSFGTVLLTITWVTSYLRLPDRTRTVLLTVFAADCILEVTGITVQAWRDAPSHFNTVGTLDAVIAYGLAIGGAVLLATLGAFAYTALRGRIDAPVSMRRAIRAGFALLMAGLAAGVAMIVRGEQLIGAGHRTLAYDTAGYLKWFHAITLHAVLVLPALAWWLARTQRSQAQQRRTVTSAIGAYLFAAAIALVVCIARS